MNKEKLITKVVSIGVRELKTNFEECYGKKEFTTAIFPFRKEQCRFIKEYLEKINKITLKKAIPFRVEVLEGNYVKFSCINKNNEVIKILIKEGW